MIEHNGLHSATIYQFPAVQSRRDNSCEPANGSPDDLPAAPTAPSFFSETFWSLPFVTLPADECDSWREFWAQIIMWNDEPTDDPAADYRRGRQYAHLAIEAIRTDKAFPRQLEIVVQRMIAGAFSRRGPGGRLCRQLSSSEEGFLNTLCRSAVEWGRQ